MARFGIPQRTVLAIIRLSSVLVIALGLALLSPSTTTAQSPAQPVSTPMTVSTPAPDHPVAQMDMPRQITRSDWVSHVPLFLGCLLLVLLVDGIFIAKIMSDRRARQAASAGIRGRG